jgi:hypothetical protein
MRCSGRGQGEGRAGSYMTIRQEGVFANICVYICVSIYEMWSSQGGW